MDIISNENSPYGLIDQAMSGWNCFHQDICLEEDQREMIECVLKGDPDLVAESLEYIEVLAKSLTHPDISYRLTTQACFKRDWDKLKDDLKQKGLSWQWRLRWKSKILPELQRVTAMYEEPRPWIPVATHVQSTHAPGPARAEPQANQDPPSVLTQPPHDPSNRYAALADDDSDDEASVNPPESIMLPSLKTRDSDSSYDPDDDISMDSLGGEVYPLIRNMELRLPPMDDSDLDDESLDGSHDGAPDVPEVVMGDDASDADLSNDDSSVPELMVRDDASSVDPSDDDDSLSSDDSSHMGNDEGCGVSFKQPKPRDDDSDDDLTGPGTGGDPSGAAPRSSSLPTESSQQGQPQTDQAPGEDRNEGSTDDYANEVDNPSQGSPDCVSEFGCDGYFYHDESEPGEPPKYLSSFMDDPNGPGDWQEAIQIETARLRSLGLDDGEPPKGLWCYKVKSKPDQYEHSPESCFNESGCLCRYPMDCPYNSKGELNDLMKEFDALDVSGDTNEPWCQPVSGPGPRFEMDELRLPTQKELEAMAQHRFDEAVAFNAGIDDAMINQVMQHPQRLRDSMDNQGHFQVIWDSGASHSISPDAKDFVGPLTKPSVFKRLTGLAKGLIIKGEGTVQWSFTDVTGNLRHIRLPAYYIPQSPVRLMGTASMLKALPGESIQITERSATLSGVEGDLSRNAVVAYNHPSNNIPTSTVYRLPRVQESAQAFNVTLNEVHKENMNLSNAEKELLRWHYKLGHLSFKRIQFLLRTGVLAMALSTRALHTAASRIKEPPKCAGCLFGKQTVTPVARREGPQLVTDHCQPILDGKMLPGQQVSVDHFMCSTYGMKEGSRSKPTQHNCYTGGALFYDICSKYIYVHFQQHMNTYETTEGKELFEDHCRETGGVVPAEYLFDSGSAFTSAAFTDHLKTFSQITKFAGVGGHHLNAPAERGIRTIMSIARSMMLHAACHWPGMEDATLWPLAVEYAVYLYNRVPDPATGLAPIDVFSGTRWPQRRLQETHVWGAPAYRLAKKLGDGQKIPRWEPRSERGIFVGISDKHNSMIAKVLNTDTRIVTTPHNVVVDDWFATVASSPEELPDFNSPEWKEIFTDCPLQFYGDGELETDPEVDPEEADIQQALQRRETVADAMDRYQFPDRYEPPVARTDNVDAPSPDTTPVAGRTRASVRVPVPVADQPPVQRERKHPSHDGTDQRGQNSHVVPDHVSSKHPTRPVLRSSASKGVIDLTESPTTDAPSLRRSTRNRNPVLQHVSGSNTYHVSLNTLCAIMNTTPDDCLWEEMTKTPEFHKASASDPDTMTLDQALRQVEHRDKWIEALEKEIRTLEEMGTWEEVPFESAEKDVIPCMWVMKIKRKPDGSLDKFKARIVVRGDLMEDYDFETKADVAQWSSVRMILILSITWGWHTGTCDYSNAFIHTKLNTPVWIQIPRGYAPMEGDRKSQCLKLLRSLYGTNFAPRLWSETVTEALLKYGLKQSKNDPCLFAKPGMMVVLHVDDCMACVEDPKEIDRFLEKMKEYGFSLTVDHTLTAFLGIKYKKLEDGAFELTQPALIDKVLEATNLMDCNPNKVPAQPGTALGKDADGPPMSESWSYPSVIGMLLYLSTNTRPDITMAVSQVARFTHDPKQSHAQAVKTLVRYLKGTKDKGSIIRPSGTLSVNCMVDASFCPNFGFEENKEKDSARSRMGYIISLGDCPLIWKSQLIKKICLSTTEAEYAALSNCLRTLIPIRRTLEELVEMLELSDDLKASISSTAFEDNSAALSLANTHKITARNRYWLSSLHFFWDEVSNGNIVVKRIPTDEQDADYLTKAMPIPGHQANRKRVQGW